MKVKIVMSGLSKLKEKLLDADLNHTKYILMDELHDTAEKLKNDRGMVFKIVRLFSRTKMGQVNFDTFTAGLETLSGMEIGLFDYSMEHIGTDISLVIQIDDVYFDLLQMSIPLAKGILGKLLSGKKKFVDEIKKSIENDYTKNYKIEVE